MKNKWFLTIGVLLGFGLLFLACPTNGDDGGSGQDALTMSDYLKYVQPRSDDWGDRLVTVYQLNPEFKDEIIAAFSKENFFVIDTYTRDWELGKTVFRYVELIELKNGNNFCPRFLDYSASDSNSVTEYKAFDEPKIGDIFEQQWDEGPMRIEYLGQRSPTSLTFTKEERFGRWMYPGYYKRTHTETGSYQYFHIIADGGKITEYEQTAWQE